MSTSYYRSRIQSLNSDLARLQTEKSRETAKIASAQAKINSASGLLSRSTSASTSASRMRTIAGHQGDIAKAQKSIAANEAKIATIQKSLMDAQKSLLREEESERRQQRQNEDRQRRQQQVHFQHIDSTLVRHESLHRSAMTTLGRVESLPPQLTVVFVASSPVDLPHLRLDEEARAIADMIRKSEFRASVRLETCWAVRPLDLLQALNEHNPGVVHFAGHGTEEGDLAFQDEAGRTKFVNKAAMVASMAVTSESIRLVYFNSCDSRELAKAVVEHVPAAIGMGSSIGDDAARIFAAQFYSSIGFGHSVRKAFEQGRAALLLESIPEDGTPELFTAEGVSAEELILVEPSGS